MSSGLPWTPKVRTRDVLTFLDTSRRKFVGYDLENDLTSTAGLPSPIKEGARVLERVSCWPRTGCATHFSRVMCSGVVPVFCVFQHV